MNSLAFNMHISHILRAKYQFCLAVLPIGLMFSSFLVLFPFSDWLAEYPGIPEGTPVKDQPNGILLNMASFSMGRVRCAFRGYYLVLFGKTVH